MVTAMLVLIAILLVVLVTRPSAPAAKGPVAPPSASDPSDYAGNGTAQTVTVIVTPGMTGSDIGRALQSAGVVKSAKAYDDAANRDQRSAGIRAGSYILHVHMSAAAALGAIVAQNPAPAP